MPTDSSQPTRSFGNVALALLVGVALIGAGALFFMSSEETRGPDTPTISTDDSATSTPLTLDASGESPVTVTPIEHATMVLDWAGTIMYVDPVGGAAAFSGSPAPDVVLLTDTDGDHFDVPTIEAVSATATRLVAPAAVADALPEPLRVRTTVLANGEEAMVAGYTVSAVAMYNLPADDPEVYHPKGQGNGYVIDDGDYRVYLAGDTEATPEFRSQEDIDLAFVPMNLPYTMDVEQAADGVLELAPQVVYPIHFRGMDGFADVGRFRELVTAENPDIEVILADWYPDTEADLPGAPME